MRAPGGTSRSQLAMLAASLVTLRGRCSGPSETTSSALETSTPMNRVGSCMAAPPVGQFAKLGCSPPTTFACVQIGGRLVQKRDSAQFLIDVGRWGGRNLKTVGPLPRPSAKRVPPPQHLNHTSRRRVL